MFRTTAITVVYGYIHIWTLSSSSLKLVVVVVVVVVPHISPLSGFSVIVLSHILPLPLFHQHHLLSTTHLCLLSATLFCRAIFAIARGGTNHSIKPPRCCLVFNFTMAARHGVLKSLPARAYDGKTFFAVVLADVLC